MNLPYYDQDTIQHYGSRKHKNQIKRLRERFEQSREAIALAAELEAEDQDIAFKAYKEMMFRRKKVTNRDDLLYHWR